ncbi:MAG: M23 family metallopeptidase [bacterium]
MSRSSCLALLVVVAACGHDGSSVVGVTDGIIRPIAVVPVPWVDGAWVQRVPSWGSPVRLRLPVPLDSIVLGPAGGLGFFGAHEGGHVEGLDHLWIPTKPGTTVGSWADGTVLSVQRIDGSYYIDIDYGHGLVGKHQLVDGPLVVAGQHVKQGDPVGTAHLAEFNLVDYNRSDGVRTEDTGGSNVSPFDYLEPDVQAALIARVMNEVVAPYFANGSTSGSSRPWEPRLTNKLLFHHDHPGTFQGEWICTNKGWATSDPLYFDVMAINDVTNAYGHFQHIDLEDYNASLPHSKGLMDGTWVPGDSAGKFVLKLSYSGATYYARYAVDESGSRAKLRLEWRLGSYPDSISSNAAVYIERKNVYLGLDAQQLGLIPR